MRRVTSLFARITRRNVIKGGVALGAMAAYALRQLARLGPNDSMGTMLATRNA